MSELDKDAGIAFGAPGRQTGGWTLTGPDGAPVFIPVFYMRGGEGPCLYINAGSHGDEYEGQVALRQVWAALKEIDINGDIIVTPSLNVPAILADQRVTPIENKDLNRAFPGDGDGGFTARLAALVGEVCVGRADMVIDLHAGGRDIALIPTVMMHHRERYATEESYHASLSAAKVFGAPHILHLEEPDHTGMLDTLVEQQGKLFVCVELGGCAQLTSATVKGAVDGVWRILHHVNLIERLPDDVEKPGGSKQFDLLPETYKVSEHNGIFEPCVELGAHVEKDALIGRFYDIADAEKEPLLFRALKEGVCIVRRGPAAAFEGDLLFSLAAPRYS